MAGLDSNVKLLLHCDGADGSTSFPDVSSSSHSISAVADAQVDTAQSKFGGASALFDGTGDYLSGPTDHVDFEFGSGDFTVDFWFRTTAGGGQWANPLISYGSSTASTSSWKVYGGQPLWGYVWQGSTNYNVTATSTTDDGAWHHCALVRDGNTLRFFIDGTEEDTVDVTGVTNNDANSAVLTIGTDSAGTVYNGHIDEVRVSDTARWTTDFTPSPGPYTSDVYIPGWDNPVHVIPNIKKRIVNPGQVALPTFTGQTYFPTVEKWQSVWNYPEKKLARNKANVSQYVFTEFTVPSPESITLDKWYSRFSEPRKRFEKKITRESVSVPNFIIAITHNNGNFIDTGWTSIKITPTGTEGQDFADTGNVSIVWQDTSDDDFTFIDSDETVSIVWEYPDTGNETFNIGIPGYIGVNVYIDGVNESSMVIGQVSVIREDNAAARFSLTLKLDQALIPPKKPVQLLNKIVAISFAAADMTGQVSDYIPIFVGISKQVVFNEDTQDIQLSGFDYGGIHQTKGEFVSENVTEVFTGSVYADTDETISVGQSPIWGVAWGGNGIVEDGVDYFVNTSAGKIIIPLSSRILQFPGSFTYSYMNPFSSMKAIIEGIASLKGWTVTEDGVTIADYSSTDEHPVLSLSDESCIDTCRKFLELSGAKVETNLYPDLRVYSEVVNFTNPSNTITIDESVIFDSSMTFKISLNNLLTEQTVRSVQKVNANVEIGDLEEIGTYSGSQGTLNPLAFDADGTSPNDIDYATAQPLVEKRINKKNISSLVFVSSGQFHMTGGTNDFEEAIDASSWTYFVDGDDFVIQLKHVPVKLGGTATGVFVGSSTTIIAYPAFEYELTVYASKIEYGAGSIEDVKVVTAQRPVIGITDTLKGDVYENPYIETELHCRNIADAILLERGNVYQVQLEIPLYEGKTANVGDKLLIQRDGGYIFNGMIKVLNYSISTNTGVNNLVIIARGVGIGI